MSYNLKVCPDDDTLTLRDCCGLRYSTNGPLKDYVILLGGRGKVPKRLHWITRGGGAIWFNPGIDKVSNKSKFY